MFIKNKSDFLTTFKHFYETVKNQLGKQIKTVTTNNAKELSQGETLDYYRSKGIRNQSSYAELHNKMEFWSTNTSTHKK